MNYVTLNNGVKMPQLGYGVYQVNPAECERCVLDAINTGYRLIDTAQAYHNEEGVGAAVQKCGVPRNELFIVMRDVDPEQIRRELADTNEDGVAVIARHMNYGLYRVEGKSDCPRDALNICRMLSLKPEIMRLIEENY